jgi:hypothetical protein
MRFGLLAAAIALILLFGYWRFRRRPHRVLSITLTSRAASGSWEGEIPPETLVMAAAQLCLLWACKVRWLLNTELPQARHALTAMLETISDSLASGSSDDLVGDLAIHKQALQALGLGSSPIGAELRLNLFYTGRAPVFWFLTNSLPTGSTLGDSIWGVAHLVLSATKNLDPQNTRALSTAMAGLSAAFEMPEANDPSVGALSQLFAVANETGLEASLQALQPQ